MISAGDFKNGLTFEVDGNVMQVIEFQHVKPGKGAAFVRAKLKNVISGATLEQTFNPTAEVRRCRRRAQGHAVQLFRRRSVLFYG